jgi:hypothetical protein
MANTNTNITLPNTLPTLENTNVTLETGKVPTLPTLENTNVTLETGKVPTLPTLENTNVTLETGKVPTLPTLETGNVAPNHAQSSTKPTPNYAKWLKPTMTVSANPQLQQDIINTDIQAENFTSFIKKLLHNNFANQDFFISAKNHNIHLEEELNRKQDQLDSLTILHEAMQQELSKKEAQLLELQQQYKAIGTTNTLLLNNAAKVATPIAPQEPKRYGIFAILNTNK